MSTATTTTENGSLAYASTKSACLDMFTSGLLRDTDGKKTVEVLESSWKEDPILAMKILMHARDCRGGKGERKAVFNALGWLRSHKPKTYAANLAKFVEVGCYRDLIQIPASIESTDKVGGKRDILELEMFAEQLEKDMTALNKFKEDAKEMDTKSALSISLASKWAPSEKRKYDKDSKLMYAKRMAQLMYPGDRQKRKRYRKTLSSLRGHLKLVETMMAKGKWSDIPFGKVPSRAHNLYKTAFRKHQLERYSKYLEDVRSGKKTIKSQGVEPHELVKHFFHSRHYATVRGDDATVEAQWRAIINKLKKDGCLKDSIAVADVSGSMEGLPMQVSIALGIMVAELSTEPFRGRLITFHETPSWHKVPVESKSLKEMVRSVKDMDFGLSTNMHKVFDLILDTAVKAKLPQASLPKTLFIFSDMQFNQAAGEYEYKTVHMHARDRYARAGYELPKIIFWNLRASRDAFPVDKDAPGVALVSGFSPDMLKMFMSGEVISPMSLMIKTVAGYEVSIDSSER